jgi:hypothetical protein
MAFLVALGSIGRRRRRASLRWLAQIMGGLVLGWCLLLPSCASSDHAESPNLALTVSMPVAGLNATDAASESITQPVSTIRGVTISTAP